MQRKDGRVLTILHRPKDVKILKSSLNPKLERQTKHFKLAKYKQSMTYCTVQHGDVDVLKEVARQPHLVPLDPPDVWHVL